MIARFVLFAAVAVAGISVPALDPALPLYHSCPALTGQLTGSATDITTELAKNWQRDFAALQPGISLDIDQPTGPPQASLNPGLRAFIDGKRDFALVSRALSDADVAAFVAVHGHPPARIAVAGGSWRSFGVLDPVVFVVNDANPLRFITQRQIAALIGRESVHPADWSGLGVSSWRGRPIHLIGGSAWRGAASARAQVVRARILHGQQLRDNLDSGSEAEVPEAVAKDPLAIGFTGLGHVAPGSHVLALSVNGGAAVAPTYANITQGRYPLARTVNLYVADAPVSAPLRAWIAYLQSREGQRIVQATAPFLPLRKNKNYKWPISGSLQLSLPHCAQ